MAVSNNFGFIPDATPVSSGNSFGFIPDSQQKGNSFLNNSLGQAAVGAGDALRNTLSSVENFVRSSPSQGQIQNASNMIGGMDLPKQPNYTPIQPVNNSSGSNPTAYNLGNIAGNIGGYMAGGGAFDTARLAAESLPGIAGQIAKSAGEEGAQGVARRAIGNAAYSGVTAPTNNSQQAETGAAASLAADAIPGAAGKLVQGAQYFMPQRYAQNIIQNLSGGQTLEDATKSVISNVKSSYDEQKQNANILYNSVRDSVPSGSIYAPVKSVYGIPSVAPTNTGIVSKSYTPVKTDYDNYPPMSSVSAAYKPVDYGNNPAWEDKTGSNTVSSLMKSAPSKPSPNISISTIVAKGKQNPSSFLEGSYPNLPQNITDNYTDTLKDMHNTFINDPTFSNAHQLQSELGAVSRQLDSKSAPPTIGTLNAQNSLNNARGALKTDMDNFLSAQSPELAQQYKNASDSYLQNVVPYKTNPKIYKMATGDITNVKPNALSNIFASPDEDMEKVLGDLPNGTIDKILYTKLGQTVPNKSAQGLLNSYQNLQQQGLGSHVSPELASQVGELENRIKARNGLQVGTAALSGGLMGAHESATAGALLGLGAGSVASPFMNYIGRRLPIDNISSAISNLLSRSYPSARTAILANHLNNSGVQQNGS
jgi:hypothetical protein